MAWTLRDYQQECVNTILERFDNLDSQIVQLPTGAGKTVILAHVIKAMGRRSLIVAPTHELIEQLEETIRSTVPKVFAKRKSYWPKNEIDHWIMTNQAATFSMHGGYIKEKIRPQLLIVDEAHRSAAKNLEKLIGHCQGMGCKVLGLTATPERADGKSLLVLYEELTYKKSILELIRQGHLLDIAYYKIATKVRVEQPKLSGGDLAPAVLRYLDQDTRNNIMLEIVRDKLLGKQTLVFCLSVEHACKMAKLLQSKGIAANAIYGNLPKKDRELTLRAFRRREIQVLCNCQLLTEGFDEPEIEAIVLGRPTKSKALYTQMIGRGLRPNGRDHKPCLVYDLGDTMHNICDFNALGDFPTDGSFQPRDGEGLQEATERAELVYKEVSYEFCKEDLFGRLEREPATSFQLKKLKEYGAPIWGELNLAQAGYLIFKSRWMEQNGHDPKTYWRKWQDNIQRAAQAERTTA